MTVLLASCSGTGDSADSTSAPAPATTQAAATGEIDGSFDVGGHKLHLRCEGICTYDRLNVGRSDQVTGRHSGADSVRDLHALLDAAGVPGPYLLVG